MLKFFIFVCYNFWILKKCKKNYSLCLFYRYDVLELILVDFSVCVLFFRSGSVLQF